MTPNCWTVVVSDGFAKPDWWDFSTSREARTFARQMRVTTGYREIKITRKYNPAFTRRDVEAARTRAVDTKEALRLIRQARTLLRKAGAKQAYKRVASVVPSVEGAARHAELVESRKEREQ